MNNKIEYKSNRKDYIDLLAIAKSILSRWWLIVLLALLFAVGFFIKAQYFTSPSYTSGYTAYIYNTTQDNVQNRVSADVTSARNLTSTYSEIIKSQPVVESAIEATGIKGLTYSSVASSISVQAVGDTEIIGIYVTTGNPETSYKIATALEEVAATNVSNIVTGSTMRVVTPSNYPGNSNKVNFKKVVGEGLIIGAVIAVVILVLVYLFDDRIRNEEALEPKYGIPVLGTIHDLNYSNRYYKKYKKYGYYSYGYGYGERRKKKEEEKNENN